MGKELQTLSGLPADAIAAAPDGSLGGARSFGADPLAAGAVAAIYLPGGRPCDPLSGHAGLLPCDLDLRVAPTSLAVRSHRRPVAGVGWHRPTRCRWAIRARWFRISRSPAASGSASRLDGAARLGPYPGAVRHRGDRLGPRVRADSLLRTACRCADSVPIWERRIRRTAPPRSPLDHRLSLAGRRRRSALERSRRRRWSR